MTNQELVTASGTTHPFKKCECGKGIPASAQYCTECARLYALGFKDGPVGTDVAPVQAPQVGPKGDK